MSDYDWHLSAGAPLCTVSDSFYRTVRETIFQQLTRNMTAEQWQAAVASLTRLRDEWQQAIYPMHYGSLVGRHRCLEHLFNEADARLRFLQIMQPALSPQPTAEPPPPPEPQQYSLEDVVDTLEATDELYIGDTEAEKEQD